MRRLHRSAWAHIPIIPPGEGGEFFTFEELQYRTIAMLKGFLRRRIGGYHVALKSMTPKNRLYRGVRWNLRRPESIDEISYPKPDRITDFGRANRTGQSMFYCCLGAFPVFLELHAKQGDLIALSEWVSSESLWMHHLGYHTDALTFMGAPIPPARHPLVHPIPYETPHNNQLRRRMSLAFTKEVPDDAKYRYKESIAINELLFDRAEPIPYQGVGAPTSDRAAGTVYPTVQMRGLADNVAIWPEFVDRYLKPVSVRYVRVEAAHEERMAYRFLTIGCASGFQDRSIMWKNELPPEDERITSVAQDGGLWIFRDGRGRIYDRHEAVGIGP